MTAQSKSVIKLKFESGDIPTGLDYIDLIDSYQDVNANLTAIAGLTSAANKGIQFTGSGAAATFDLTTAGKALLDDANAAAQRTTLGLGTAATTAASAYATAAQGAKADTAVQSQIDKRPILPVSSLVTWHAAYAAGYGTPSLLADATGNGLDLPLTAGSVPTLVANSAPSGRSSLTLSGTQEYGRAISGIMRQGSIWVLIGRPSADSTLLSDTDGWRVSMKMSGNTLKFGQLDSEGSSLTAARQFSVYMGVFNDTYAVPYTNQFQSGTGAAGNDTNVPGFKLKMAGDFVGLLIGTANDPTSQLSNVALAQIFDQLFPMIRPNAATSILCRGNSIVAGVGLNYADTIPGLIAAAFPTRKVGSLAISGITTADLSRIAPAQCDGSPNIAADVCMEVTNDIAYGANAGDGAAAGAAFLNHIRTRVSARPNVAHVFGDCLPRSGTTQSIIDAANTAIAAQFTVTTAEANVFTSTSADLANCYLVKQSLITPRSWNVDGIHPDAAFNIRIANRFIAALRLAGL